MGLLRITELSKVLNIHPNTLRNWEKQGKISPERTVGGHRRYDLKKIESILKLKYKTLLGTEKTRRFTFVFNQNESELSVGHHLDEIGNVCE